MDFLCGDKMYELVIDPTQLNREYLTDTMQKETDTRQQSQQTTSE
jgi:hypothetical protein